MCDAVSAAYLVVAAAGSAMQVQQSRKNTEAQNRMVENNYRIQQGQLYQKQVMENRQLADQKLQVQEQAQANRASLETAAGESGVAGNILSRAMTAANINESRSLIRLDTNGEAANLAYEQQGQSMQMNAQQNMGAKQSYSTVLLDTGLKALQIGAAKYGPGLVNQVAPAKAAPSIFGGTAPVSSGSFYGTSPKELQAMGILNDNQSYFR